MRLPLLLFISAFLSFSACNQQVTPEEFLDQSRAKLFDPEGLSYHARAMYPSPTGKVDTSSFTLSFEVSESSLIGYDYIAKWKNKFTDKDLIYMNDDYKVVSHLDGIVRFYPDEYAAEEEQDIEKALPIKNSPLRYLKQTDWTFLGDTLMNGQSYKRYMRIEAERVHKENKILTEHHIFIDEASRLLHRFERRNHLNGELSQLVAWDFWNYTFRSTKGSLSYEYPENYTTSLMGADPYENLREAGEKAPDFVSRDENGNIVKLSDYRGKKVLLDFSIIHCGYCLQSLKHFNDAGYELAGNVAPLYINPIDSKEDMTDFSGQFNIPFPVVVSGASEIAEKYGVLSYPVFFLIDEEGIIEKVVTGFDKQFQESLRS